MSTLCDKLRKLRSDRGYSEVARSVDHSTNAIRDVEAGRTSSPSVWMIRALADLYGVSIDWLTDDSQDWPPPKAESESIADVVRESLAAGGYGDLDERERDLIREFRSLPPREQDVAFGYVMGVASSARANPPESKSGVSLGDRVARSLGHRKRESG